MKIFYTYILMTKIHKFHWFHVLDFWEKNNFIQLAKFCQKYTFYTGKAQFSENNIAKPYHKKIHWFEHTHVPNP
jgi:hypothetical protein